MGIVTLLVSSSFTVVCPPMSLRRRLWSGIVTIASTRESLAFSPPPPLMGRMGSFESTRCTTTTMSVLMIKRMTREKRDVVTSLTSMILIGVSTGFIVCVNDHTMCTHPKTFMPPLHQAPTTCFPLRTRDRGMIRMLRWQDQSCRTSDPSDPRRRRVRHQSAKRVQMPRNVVGKRNDAWRRGNRN